jgi:hypothetical protein
LTQLLGKRVDLALKDALKPHIGKRKPSPYETTEAPDPRLLGGHPPLY